MKLSPTQAAVLARLAPGQWATAYDLQTSLPTLLALERTGHLRSRNKGRLGAMFAPRNTIEFQRKEKP
jgi:hypothetical protein